MKHLALLCVLAALVPAARAASSSAVLVVPAEGRDSAVDQAWISQAVAEVLPRDLGFLGVQAIDADERRRTLEALEIPDVPTTLATSIRVAEALQAARLVTGTYAVENGVLQLALRLMDVERGTLSSPLVASGPVESLRELLHGLAWDIALAGPTRPARTREELRRRDNGVPFSAFRSYCEALRSGDPSRRQRLLRQALKLSPGYDDAELALGALLLQTREFQPALEVLAQIGPEFPGQRRARFLRGVALYEAGRYQEAANLYAALSSEAPGASVLNNHALALLRAGASSPKSSQVLRAALAIEPGAPDLVFNLGWALLWEGQGEEAAFWLRGLRREDSRDLHARVVLTWALRRAGRAVEADAEWAAVLAQASAYAALAMPEPGRRFERLRSSEAAPALAREARSDAELSATHAARGEKLLESGDAVGALAELTRAAYLDPYGARVHRLLARTHLARGERDKAATEFAMSLWCRDDPAVRLEWASVLRDLGQLAEARAQARAVLASVPGHPAALELLAALGP
jgi:tetratricopeptide (TPR) repeat protein